MDELMKLYHALSEDELIREQVTSSRIKFYEYPETGDVSGTVIIIDPLSSPVESVYGDDEPISEDFMLQVDVWGRNASSVDSVAKRITKVFRDNGYYYNAAGPRDYDEGIHRHVRRYTGRYYTEEFTGAQ